MEKLRDGVYSIQYYSDQTFEEVEISYAEDKWWVKDKEGTYFTLPEFNKMARNFKFIRALNPKIEIKKVENFFQVDEAELTAQTMQNLKESIKNHSRTNNYLPYPPTPEILPFPFETIDHQIFALSQNIKSLNAFFGTEVFSNFLSFLQFPYELKNNILYVYASNVRREVISKLDITSCKEFIKNNVMMVKGDNVILFLDTNREIKE